MNVRYRVLLVPSKLYFILLIIQAKKRQAYLEETYGGNMRELEILVNNFPALVDVTGKKKQAGERTLWYWGLVTQIYIYWVYWASLFQVMACHLFRHQAVVWTNWNLLSIGPLTVTMDWRNMHDWYEILLSVHVHFYLAALSWDLFQCTELLIMLLIFR